MSQVVVTSDSLKVKRERSRVQEQQIDKNQMYKHWQKSDITGKDLFASTVGYAVTPILALWSLISGMMALVIIGLGYIFKVVGKVIGGARNLILPENEVKK